MKLKKEALKDGIVLRRLMEDFNKDKNEETLFRVLVCLKDSIVYIPCIPSEKNVIGSAEGKNYALMTFTKDGKKYAGLFTHLSQMSSLKAYKMEVPFKDLFPYVKGNKLDIVLDPMTKPMIIPASLFIVLEQIPSQLEE